MLVILRDLVNKHVLFEEARLVGSMKRAVKRETSAHALVEISLLIFVFIVHKVLEGLAGLDKRLVVRNVDDGSAEWSIDVSLDLGLEVQDVACLLFYDQSDLVGSSGVLW